MQKCNLVPRTSYLTGPGSKRGETLAHAGHVSLWILKTSESFFKVPCVACVAGGIRERASGGGAAIYYLAGFAREGICGFTTKNKSTRAWNPASYAGYALRYDRHYHRPLQKRERTGKEHGCFQFVWKTKIFKWKINYILECLPRIEVFGGGKWQNGSSTNITKNREFV